MPYVYGFGADAPDGGYNGRGSLHSGQIMSNNVSYSGAGSFNPVTGAAESSGFDGRGVLAFTRGIAGGFGGWEGNEYTGPFGESTIDYTYPDNHVRPHAVTARSNGDTFTYDANGNMTQRVQDGVTWTQTFDAENRLVSVSNNATPSTTTTYVYDGSGSRLRRIVNDGSIITTTLYVGNMEIQKVGTTETQRTVYYGGAFRIIGGSNAGLYYVHGDHLGSVSVLSDANGMKIANSDVVYAPFGEVRSGSESNLTDFGYTGQRKDDGTGGLMYYGARYYLPGIQHFISADSIVPGIIPQALNRYAYVLNNPIRYSDPSGHVACEGSGACGWYKPKPTAKPPAGKLKPPGKPFAVSVAGAGATALGQAMRRATAADCDATQGSAAGCTQYLSETYDVTVEFDNSDPYNQFSLDQQLKALNQIWQAVEALAGFAVEAIEKSLPNPWPGTPEQAFKMLFGPTLITIQQGDEVGKTDKGKPIFGQNDGWNQETKRFEIQLAYNKMKETDSNAPGDTGVGLVVHEIAHNITYADGEFNTHLVGDMKKGIGGKPLGYVTIDGVTYYDGSGLYKYMTVNAGDYNPTAPFEFSADLIANLALDGFKNDKVEQFAWDWFTQNLSVFTRNMACTIGGDGYACSHNYNE